MNARRVVSFRRKTDGKKDECIVAQEKMHPACAQRIEGAELPTCHSLAEACKENRGCRYVAKAEIFKWIV